jgi:hypothetical protein
MTQEPLFPDVLSQRTTAIEADVNAAGGQQIVGHKLGLHDDPVEAGKLLSNKIRRNGRHRLSDEETWAIREMARESMAGKSHLHELESALLNYEGGRWLTSEDIKAKRRKRKAALLRELIELEQEEE